MSTSWRKFPRTHGKPARDFHRPRYGNPLFPNAAGSKVVRRGAANTNNRNTTRRTTSNAGGSNKRRNVLIAIGLLIAGAAWYVFWGPAFRITKTEFVGTSPFTEETLRHALSEYQSSNALLVFPRNNVLLFSETSAKDAVRDAVYLDDIQITKKLPDTVIITVKEKAMRAVLERGGRLFAVDDSGYVLRELTSKEREMMPDLPPGLNAVSVEGLGAQAIDLNAKPGNDKPTEASADAAAKDDKDDSDKKDEAAPAKAPAADTPGKPSPAPRNAWPLILDHSPIEAQKKTPFPGMQAYTPSTLSAILQAGARLPDVTGETVRWFTPDESSDSVDATMASGWHVYLATATPFDVQADRLSIILKDKIGNKRGELEYVDLRYNEKIFYRLKNQVQ